MQGTGRTISHNPQKRAAEKGNSYIVMHICHTRHRDEGNIVQDPADERIDAGIVNLVDIILLEFIISSLPSNEVPSHQCYHHTQACSRSPVYDRVTQQEIFHDLTEISHLASTVAIKLLTAVVPSTHSESDVENRPLPEMRCQIILLIGVWD